MIDLALDGSAPSYKPRYPFFSSGPCFKGNKWPLFSESALLSRSHRSPSSLKRIQDSIKLTRSVLCIPDEYYIAFVPGSGTGALECALWNFLGFRGVDVYTWDCFGDEWLYDITNQLNVNRRCFRSSYGSIPSFAEHYDPSRDFVSVYNGTSCGVSVDNLDFIADDREGLVIMDYTSYAFAYPIDWRKIDVCTFAWQKVLGAESNHGVAIFSSRAINFLKNYSPKWPIPRLFRLKDKSNVFSMRPFEGYTLNTISMACLQDYFNRVSFLKKNGGIEFAYNACVDNSSVIYRWLDSTILPIKALPENVRNRSITSVCMCFDGIEKGLQSLIQDAVISFFEKHSIAYDIRSYPNVPIGFRIWTGPTILLEDLNILVKWMDWILLKILKSINYDGEKT